MMLLTPNYNGQSNTYQYQRRVPQKAQFAAVPLSQNPSNSNFYPQHQQPTDSEIDPDSETTSQSHSISSSPQSFVSQFPLSTFDSLPSAVPRTLQNPNPYYRFPTPATQSQLLPPIEMSHTDAWLGNGQITPKSAGRMSHHRESSLSSLGSAGPASPYSYNTCNPQIAVTDSMNDTFHGLPLHGLPLHEDSSYHQMAKSFASIPHDTLYTNYASNNSGSNANGYSGVVASQKQGRGQNGLLPPPDFPSGSTKSRPVSVASSITSDSPATPAALEPEQDRRRRTGLTTVPKLDRTMTDVYSDELYNPNFSFTSTSPAQPSQISTSPNNEVFAQRLQAANSQHLSAHSPVVPSVSRGHSPFRQGSPLAPAPMNDFGSTPQQMRFNSAQQLREQKKAEQDAAAAQAIRQSMKNPAGTPQTISPKDAILEFNDADNDSNFSLFPSSQGSNGFGTQQVTKTEPQSNSQQFNNLSLDTSFNYMTSGVQVPQQYPFVAQPRQQSNAPSMSNGSMMPSRVGSSESLSSDSMTTASIHRPESTSADSGTYTCTYHGCTQRFETPALLQKHKREGHRQAHGMNGVRRVETSPAAAAAPVLNTQAGPHRCDRINPSTGKSCATVFSRPYDLTRHEDTIHNARKQKVRCHICTEEKTFSRADALTRHFRVCHPEVEFQGKHRRRGVPV